MGNKVIELSKAIKELAPGKALKVQYREFATNTVETVEIANAMANKARVPSNISFYLKSNVEGAVLVLRNNEMQREKISLYDRVTITFDCCPD